jgi:hypothetical protein
VTLAGEAPGRGRRVDRSPVVALVVASVFLVASIVMAAVGVLGPAPWRSASLWGAADSSRGMPWTVSDQRGGGMMDGRSGDGMWGGGPGGMMAGQIWLAGDGQPVALIAQARARAAQAATARGLHPGEVMQFTNNFYVELKDSTGAATTEVLVDPTSGTVQTEPGPAMMWNTGSRTGALTQEQATQAATAWLTSNRPGENVKSIDAYPGYYTVDTAAGGKMVGMLSVNATTGAVWYHTWHGSFVGMDDA